MVNNPALFNGALVGGCGGAQERWITNPNAASYSTFADANAALATMVDSQIAAVPGGATVAQSQLMQSICQGVMAQRYLSGLAPADYAAISQAIAGLYTAVNAKLQPSSPEFDLTSPVYVEEYLAANGNDLRAAIVAAHTANTAVGTVFVLPIGEWPWVGATFQPRNYTHWQMQGCTIYRDMLGVASGQIIFFLRSDTGVGTAARGITFHYGTFELRNALTSYFGYAIGFEAAADCLIDHCVATCTLVGGATTGRQRWGFAFFGGDRVADPTCGRSNRFESCTLTLAQIQGCGSGRSVDGITVRDTIVLEANDLAISVVSTGATKTLENVSIINTICHDVAGSGMILAGTDGNGTGIGVGVVRNLLIDGVWMNGARPIDLDFGLLSAIVVDGGLVTENVVITNVGTKLVSTELQSRSILVASQDDEVSWHGLEISNFSLGIVTTNDPLEPLFIAGRNITGLNIVNGNIRGLRGIRIVDCDLATIDNVTMEDGQLTYFATNRNLTAGINISNCNFTRVTGFNNSLLFSSAGRNFAKVMLSNLVLNCAVAGINVALGGGTMQMWLDNIENTSNSNPSAETLTGIIRCKNLRGFIVPVTVSVVVPAVAAASVGYVTVSMAGNRLSDLIVGENVVAAPTADLVAAGAGGAYVNARVSAVGMIRLAFLGALAGGAVDFNFDRVG